MSTVPECNLLVASEFSLRPGVPTATAFGYHHDAFLQGRQFSDDVDTEKRVEDIVPAREHCIGRGRGTG